MYSRSVFSAGKQGCPDHCYTLSLPHLFCLADTHLAVCLVVQSSHSTHASYARHARPDLCVHGAAAEVLACMYGGVAGMERLQQDLGTGAFDACKVIPGKSGKTINRTYLSQYIRQCLLKAGVDMEAPVSDDFEWYSLNPHWCKLTEESQVTLHPRANELTSSLCNPLN